MPPTESNILGFLSGGPGGFFSKCTLGFNSSRALAEISLTPHRFHLIFSYYPHQDQFSGCMLGLLAGNVDGFHPDWF